MNTAQHTFDHAEEERRKRKGLAPRHAAPDVPAKPVAPAANDREPQAEPLFYRPADAPIGVDLVATALTATQSHFAYCWRRPDGTYAAGRVEHDLLIGIHFTPDRVRLRDPRFNPANQGDHHG